MKKYRINQFYILKNKRPCPIGDVLVWARWFEDNGRLVQATKKGEVRVSTVFLGIDHGFGISAKPILFETMVFGGKHDGRQVRYCTWGEAVKGHKAMVDKVFKHETN